MPLSGENSLLSPLPIDWSKSNNGSDVLMYGLEEDDDEKFQNCNILMFDCSYFNENTKLLRWSVWQKSRLVLKQGDSTCR